MKKEEQYLAHSSVIYCRVQGDKAIIYVVSVNLAFGLHPDSISISSPVYLQSTGRVMGFPRANVLLIIIIKRSPFALIL